MEVCKTFKLPLSNMSYEKFADIFLLNRGLLISSSSEALVVFNKDIANVNFHSWLSFFKA